jgi:hypothetical protein
LTLLADIAAAHYVLRFKIGTEAALCFESCLTPRACAAGSTTTNIRQQMIP